MYTRGAAVDRKLYENGARNSSLKFNLFFHQVFPSALSTCRFFPYIFNMSGGTENVKKFGSWFSYEGSPRAQIFKRDHHKVVDMNSMMKLMRFVLI